jgi:aldose 1-epimerase
VELYTIANGRIELRAITYGGIITSLRVPDRDGRKADVVLGFDHLEPYLENRAYIGALVGRYANRIAGGHFHLDGVSHRLAANDGPNHLHGGHAGFSRRLWSATPLTTDQGAGISLARTSPAGEEGYPGALHVEVSYVVTTDNTVLLRYAATADAATIVNLTQHSYFNLAGESSTSVLDHQLTILADRYLPVGPTLIPTGAVASVAGTPFDFRDPVRLAERAPLSDPPLRIAGGYDHNFVLAASSGDLTLAAALHDPESGRTLRIRTTEPGVQFYDGHLLDGCIGAHHRTLGRHAGLCLETQHFPDSPNQPGFPSVVLRPDERYSSTTAWDFDVL